MHGLPIVWRWCSIPVVLGMAACALGGRSSSDAAESHVTEAEAGAPLLDHVDPSYGAGGEVKGADGYGPGFAFSKSGRAVVQHRYDTTFLSFTSFLPNGAPDTKAGPEGSVRIELPGTHVYSRAIQAGMRIEDDGTILFYGSRKQAAEPLAVPFPFIARLKDGAFDPSFGTGGVRLWTDHYASVSTVAPERDAKGAVTGYYVVLQYDPAGGASGLPAREASEARLFRLDAAGALDTTFGKAGAVEIPVVRDEYPRVSVDGQGRVVVARRSCELYRFTAGGVADTTFGKDGVATHPGATCDAHVLPDGAMLVRAVDNDSTSFFHVSAAGVYGEPLQRTERKAGELLLFGGYADGRLLVFRYNTGGASTFERWLADGTPDPKFGAFETSSAAAAHVNEDGTIALASFTANGGNIGAGTGAYPWQLQRLHADPRPRQERPDGGADGGTEDSGGNGDATAGGGSRDASASPTDETTRATPPEEASPSGTPSGNGSRTSSEAPGTAPAQATSKAEAACAMAASSHRRSPLPLLALAGFAVALGTRRRRR